jgi:hypothetical protein
VLSSRGDKTVRDGSLRTDSRSSASVPMRRSSVHVLAGAVATSALRCVLDGLLMVPPSILISMYRHFLNHGTGEIDELFQGFLDP